MRLLLLPNPLTYKSQALTENSIVRILSLIYADTTFQLCYCSQITYSLYLERNCLAPGYPASEHSLEQNHINFTVSACNGTKHSCLTNIHTLFVQGPI